MISFDISGLPSYTMKTLYSYILVNGLGEITDNGLNKLWNR